MKLPVGSAIKKAKVCVSFKEAMKKISLIVQKKIKNSFLHSKTIETSFGDLHYYDSDPSGKLAPLLLTHGLGSNGQSFFLLAPFFSGQRRVIIPDLFQFSGKSRAKEKRPLSIAEHAQSIEELCRALGVECIDMCGLSMGGWISIWLSIHNPALVKTLTLINPGGIGLQSSDLKDKLLALDWHQFGPMYESIIYNRWFRQAPFIAKATKKVMYQGLSHKNVREFVETVDENDLIDDKISKVVCPTLLLWGFEDAFLPRNVPYVLMKEIKDIRGFFIFKTGHIPSIEAPLNVYLLMRQFLKFDDLPGKFLSQVARCIFPKVNTTPIVVGGMSEQDFRL